MYPHSQPRLKRWFFAGIFVSVFSCALAGCTGANGAGRSEYTVLERVEGPGQVTYKVQVGVGLSQSGADAIGQELRGRESKPTMVNIYDGPGGTQNMIFSCQEKTCFATKPTG